MKRKVFKGWIGKTVRIDEIGRWEGELLHINSDFIWKTKGKKAEWMPDNWPPRRVTITVEVED